MVMNDLQYAFLYEVVREAFWAKYRAKPEGAVIKGGAAGVAASSKSEKEKGNDSKGEGGVSKGKFVKSEDATGETEEEAGSASEAETEIIGKDDDEEGSPVGDPYAVVAPPSIREGIKKEP